MHFKHTEVLYAMFRLSIVLLLMATTILQHSDAATVEDPYCNITGCFLKHIACGYNDEFGPECVKPKIVNLKPHIRQILDKHNSERNAVAEGNEYLEPASRMAQMRWDKDLAHFAQVVANTCKLTYGKPNCRATNRFRYIGEISGGYGYKGKKRKPEDIIEKLLNNWFKTIELLDHSHIKKYEKSDADRGSLLVTDRNNHVGCAAIRHIKNDMNYFSLICNYATNNILGKRIYEEGGVAAEKCKIKNNLYNNLCHPHEKYKLN